MHLHYSLKTFLLIMVLVLAASVNPVAAGAPTEEVKSIVDEVIRLLGDPALKSPAQKSQRRQKIKQLVDRRFDYEEMAKRSLGANWSKLNQGQRREFVKLFSELLEASYADKIEKYSDEKVLYTAEQVDGNYAEVRTVLVRRNDKIPMNYRLMDKSPWMVYDVVIEGVSLIGNYRSQFSRIITESSYAELVRRLRTKVDELQKLENS
jgi:phospholipid transport system substrate-binding protein